MHRYIGKFDWKSDSSDGELECVSAKVTQRSERNERSEWNEWYRETGEYIKEGSIYIHTYIRLIHKIYIYNYCKCSCWGWTIILTQFHRN